MEASVGLCTFTATDLTRRSQPKGYALTGNRTRRALGRAAVVVVLAVASLGVTAGPAQARPAVCKIYMDGMKWAWANFRAAAGADNALETRFWLLEYSAIVSGASDAGC
jgi:hypothetical protein